MKATVAGKNFFRSYEFIANPIVGQSKVYAKDPEHKP